MTSTLGSVLIVDDSATTCATLSGRLRRSGYDVELAETGEDALQLMRSQPFDLVLLDVELPGIDGLAVLREIRRRYSQFQLPVIMASGKDDSGDVVHALRLGANDYITKPFDLSVVVARVATHVILHQTAQSLEDANRRLQTDLSAAAEIQRSQLPAAAPEFEGVNVSWLYLPCDELAGDFLNAFDLVGRQMGLYLLDVTGHGVPAALLSVAVSRTLLPSLDETCLVTKSEQSTGGVSLQVTAPIEVVDRLNRRFAKERESGRLFTILYGILDGDTGKLRYASAGHPGPVHLPARGDAMLLPGIGFPIGLVHPDEPGYGYEEYAVQLQPQDRVYLYSDGIVDAQDSHGEPFGEQRWLKLLDSTRDQALAESVQTVKAALEGWCGATPLVDDLSLLAVEYLPS